MNSFTICPLGKLWVNCLKPLKKLSIYLPGKTPSAPSVMAKLRLLLIAETNRPFIIHSPFQPVHPISLVSLLTHQPFFWTDGPPLSPPIPIFPLFHDPYDLYIHDISRHIPVTSSAHDVKGYSLRPYSVNLDVHRPSPSVAYGVLQEV